MYLFYKYKVQNVQNNKYQMQQSEPHTKDVNVNMCVC